MHWNSKSDTLELGKEVLCSVSEHYSQYTLEYNPVQSAVHPGVHPGVQSAVQPTAFTNSHLHPVNPATPELWHHRLGHPGPKAIANLLD